MPENPSPRPGAVVTIVLSEGDALPPGEGVRCVSAGDFLAGRVQVDPGRPVVNLCRERGYLSHAWYVSLLAEARGCVPLPEPALLEAHLDRRARDRALREEGVDLLDREEIEARVQAMIEAGVPAPGGVPIVDDPDEPKPRLPTADERLVFRIFAGRPWPTTSAAGQPALPRLARRIFNAWPLPLAQAELVRDAGRWRLVDLRPVDLDELSDGERVALVDACAGLRLSPPATYDGTPSLAVLWSGADPACASTSETIDRLARVARRSGLRVERIGPDDLDRLGEHDALFIRTLTGVDQPSWRFATRAEALGMPVIDHPTTIVRCSNKVYLQELLSRAGLATPPTVIFGRDETWEELTDTLGTPLIVKVPDGSFSTAVFKIASAEDFAERVPPLLERSPLLVAQAFLPTSFDWRIGVLDGRLLYAARYHMVHGHWQIRAVKGASVRFGRVEAVPRDQVPKTVRKLATSAAALVSDGLLGLDIKETAQGPVVVEINDNPNIDVGYEDTVEGDRLYEGLVAWFMRRLNARVGAPPPVAKPASRSRARDQLDALRRPIGRVGPARTTPYGPLDVVGIELEYSVVDRDLNVAHLAEETLAMVGGRPCSDVDLGRVGISNEIVDHVLELKNVEPHRELQRAEADLVEGVRRVSLLLDDRFRARLLPGGMHPWYDPRDARLWRRAGSRIYETYARLFDVHTHGWANVQAVHVNLPMGSPEDATAMMNAARLLVPYLPALAASSPLVEGELTQAVDNRVAWLLEHQARIPESMGRLVPHPLARYADYRRDVLGPMYAAIDKLPDAGRLRAEYLNARGAVFKPSRMAMEVRILDVQECVAMDVAIAWFVRRALRWLMANLHRLAEAPQVQLEDDLLAVARAGSRARVLAPFVGLDNRRGTDGRVEARDVVAWLFDKVDHRVPKAEVGYRDLVGQVVEHGSLAERILARLRPLADAGDQEFTDAARRVWIELADCLVDNRPWSGRSA